jgi:hypothetical protein
MAQGYWVIVQSTEYTNPSIISWTYTKSGTLIATLNPDATLVKSFLTLQRMGGGIYKFLPPLQFVKKKYKYRNSPNDSGSLLPVQDDYTTAVPFINSVQGGGGESLYFTGTIHEIYTTSPAIIKTFYAQYKLRIVLTTNTTTYYLSGVLGGSPLTWSTTATDYVLVNGNTFLNGISMTQDRQFEFYTPSVPANGTATFEFDFSNYVVNGVVAGTFDYVCQNFSVVLEGTYTETTGNKEYFVYNGSMLGSAKLELKDTAIGDGVNTYSIGRLETYNGSTWGKTYSWSYGNPPISNSGNSINQLSIGQNLNGQTQACETFQGAWQGDYYPEMAIGWGIRTLVPMQLEFSPIFNTYTGVWFNALIPAFNVIYD